MQHTQSAFTMHARHVRHILILVTRGTFQPKVALFKVVAPAPHRIRAVEEDDDPLVVHLRIARWHHVSICDHLYICPSMPVGVSIYGSVDPSALTSGWFSSHLEKARNLLKTAPSR